MTRPGISLALVLLLAGGLGCDKGAPSDAARVQVEAAAGAPEEIDPAEPPPAVEDPVEGEQSAGSNGVLQPHAGPMPGSDSGEAPLAPFAIARLDEPGHLGAVTQVVWSADGETLVSVGDDGHVRLWDGHSWALERTLPGSSGSNHDVASNRDGSRVLSNHERELRLDDGETGARLATMQHEGETFAVAMSEDAQHLASGGADGVRMWSADGAAVHHINQRGKSVKSLSFSVDGSRLASGWEDGRIRIIDVDSGTIRSTIRVGEAVEDLALSADGARVAARTKHAQSAVFEVETGKVVVRLDSPRPLAFGANGNLLLVASQEDADTSSFGPYGVTLIDVNAGEPVRTYAGHEGPVHAATFGQQGMAIATASADTSVVVWTAP